MPSKVVMFHSDADYGVNSFLIGKSDIHQTKSKLLETFQKYILNTKKCRQVMIEHYFEHGNLEGGISDKDKCGTCDNCTGIGLVKTEETDVFKEARLIVGLVRSLRVNFGVVKLIGILRGTLSKFSNSNYYRTGRHKTVEWWKNNNHIVGTWKTTWLRNAFSRYTVIGVGSKNIKNVSVINLQLPATKQCSASKQYLDIRKRLSVFNKVSPYMIINDKVLADISTANPQTVADLLMVDGVSNAFINKYGDFFIGVVEKKRSSSGTSSTTKDMSYTMYQSGKSINNIVSSRGLKRMTIESHITDKMGENLKRY